MPYCPSLGDPYAIYGFSGYTHMRCEVFRVEGFSEAYDERVKSRISRIQPQDYTRMGAVIRHLSGKLLEIDARTRLLITLSDGRPDDEDGYRGDYGIEDTRQALFEARFQGYTPLLHHHRRRGPGLPSSHVRRVQLQGHRGRRQAAL